MFTVLMALIVGLGTGAAVQKFSDRDESIHSEDQRVLEWEWAGPCVEELLYDIQSDGAPSTEAAIKKASTSVRNCMRHGAEHGDI